MSRGQGKMLGLAEDGTVHDPSNRSTFHADGWIKRNTHSTRPARSPSQHEFASDAEETVSELTARVLSRHCVFGAGAFAALAAAERLRPDVACGAMALRSA
jgi:hypothetical protein